MRVLAAENISKRYGERALLSDVTLQINQGDKIGLIGVNGTGKSTLLRLLAGEEVPDGGSHDELRLRRMHFYVRHGFVLEPVRSRVYGVTYRVISYARPASMTADDVCAALRAIYEELLASRLRMRLHVRIWQQEPEF